MSVMSRTGKIRSPKGLVGVRSRQLKPGFELEPRVRQRLVKKNLAALKKIAVDAIARGHGKPGRYLSIVRGSKQADRAYFGACVLRGLDQIERRWQQQPDAFLALVEAALILAGDAYDLAIVDNELQIDTASKTLLALQRKSQAANARRQKAASAKWAKWNVDAQRIWKRNPSLSADAVATQLKEKLGLPDEVGTIRKRLKKPGTASGLAGQVTQAAIGEPPAKPRFKMREPTEPPSPKKPGKAS
jgi:hypothetical protein